MKLRTEERGVRLLLLITDLLLYAAALRLAAFSVLNTLVSINPYLLERDRLVCLAVFGFSAFTLGCYDPRRITDRFDSVYYMLLAVGLTVILVLALGTLVPPGIRVISRRELILSAPLAGISLYVWRFYAQGFIAGFRSLHRRFYVLGSAAEGERIAHAINADHHLHADARYVTSEDFLRELQGRDASDLAHVPEDAIIEITSENRRQLTELLSFCEEHFQRVFLYPSFEDLLLFDHGKVLAVAGIPLVEVASMGAPYPYVHVKRAMDVGFAAAGLLGSLPISICAAIAVKLTSPGPIIYSQERLGKGGRPFKIYKFRSMRADMEAIDATGHVLAGEDDPRITPVGKFIRAHRIDEIPQLVNVLKGDMSLIGPRPVWREFYDTHRHELPLIDLRLSVRPGLTSLSHVLGSYTSEPRDRLRYDLVYISTLSLLTDLKILFQTVRIVLSGRGAQ